MLYSMLLPYVVLYDVILLIWTVGCEGVVMEMGMLYVVMCVHVVMGRGMYVVMVMNDYADGMMMLHVHIEVVMEMGMYGMVFVMEKVCIVIERNPLVTEIVVVFVFVFVVIELVIVIVVFAVIELVMMLLLLFSFVVSSPSHVVVMCYDRTYVSDRMMLMWMWMLYDVMVGVLVCLYVVRGDEQWL